MLGEPCAFRLMERLLLVEQPPVFPFWELLARRSLELPMLLFPELLVLLLVEKAALLLMELSILSVSEPPGLQFPEPLVLLHTQIHAFLITDQPTPLHGEWITLLLLERFTPLFDWSPTLLVAGLLVVLLMAMQALPLGELPGPMPAGLVMLLPVVHRRRCRP